MTASVAIRTKMYVYKKEFKKEKEKRERKREKGEKIIARIFCACISTGAVIWGQTDLNVSHNFGLDFNYPSRVPAIRSLAGDTARPPRGFSVLAGENAMNALVDNEISRQFHRRANAGLAS